MLAPAHISSSMSSLLHPNYRSTTLNQEKKSKAAVKRPGSSNQKLKSPISGTTRSRSRQKISNVDRKSQQLPGTLTQQHSNLQSIQSLAANSCDLDDLNKRIAENVMNKILFDHKHNA